MCRRMHEGAVLGGSLKRIDKIRFRECVRIGPEELYYAYNGGVKEYTITLHEGFVQLNDVYVPLSNVTQFTLLPEVSRVQTPRKAG